MTYEFLECIYLMALSNNVSARAHAHTHTGASKMINLVSRCNNFYKWTAIAQSVWRLATGWTVRESNPAEDEIFHTGPDRP